MLIKNTLNLLEYFSGIFFIVLQCTGLFWIILDCFDNESAMFGLNINESEWIPKFTVII